MAKAVHQVGTGLTCMVDVNQNQGGIKPGRSSQPIIQAAGAVERAAHQFNHGPDRGNGINLLGYAQDFLGQPAIPRLLCGLASTWYLFNTALLVKYNITETVRLYPVE